MTVRQDPTSALQSAQRFLTSSGLQAADDAGRWTELTGGVSSNLWRVELADRTLCVKGALAQLRVADEWFAPVDRNAVEYAWLEFAGTYRPASVPKLYAHDRAAGFFAMEYLQPDQHPVWKSQLMRGEVDPDFAAAVGRLLGQLHAASTHEPDIPARFATDENFAALRLDPFFATAGRRNPTVADQLAVLSERTAGTRLALVHGDVSPKNLLVGPHGPVILDAECAWFGDPAFDVAFCLAHLALKMLVVPATGQQLLDSAGGLLEAYLAEVEWESPSELQSRVASLLPGLLLARVDGASPVEYLSGVGQRDFVRATALWMLAHPSPSAQTVLQEWHGRAAAAG